MASYPTDLRYTTDHVWLRARDKLVTVGITEAEAERLGAISFLELPYPGELFKRGEMLGRASGESASAPIRMPLVGQINSVNPLLGDEPGLINSDAHGAGWIVRIEPNDLADVDALMDAEAYEAFLAADGGE